MTRDDVIDRLISQSDFSASYTAAGRIALRGQLRARPVMDFCQLVQKSYNLSPPARPSSLPRSPLHNSQPADRYPPFVSSRPADDIGQIRHDVATRATAWHEAWHAAANCWYGNSDGIILVEADGDAGCCRYSTTNMSAAACRRVTIAPVVALQPDFFLRTPGYSGDRQDWLDALRECGNRGDDYDLMASADAQGDEFAVEEMIKLCSQFVNRLAPAIIRSGRLDGATIAAYWGNWLRENEWVRERLPRK